MPYWRLFYHITWSLQGRLPTIMPECETRIHAVIAAKAQEIRAIVHAIGGTAEHMHVAASVPPSLPLSRFVGEVKGSSSHFVNHVLRPEGHFAWQASYGVVSFGEGDLARVVRYIRRQKQHHAQGQPNDALETWASDEGATMRGIDRRDARAAEDPMSPDSSACRSPDGEPSG